MTTDQLREETASRAETDMAAFVTAYREARRTNESDALAALWHDDGTLYHPNLSAPIAGSLLPAFKDYTLKQLPDIVWTLDDWAVRGTTVYLEWTCHATVAGQPTTWRGVDRMIMRDGRISEEYVYCDTMPIWEALDPSMRRPPLIDAAAL